MGLIDDDGTPVLPAIEVLARAHAGIFYDDLYNHGNMALIKTTTERLSALLEEGDPVQALLGICHTYNEMHRHLPDMIWWVAGSRKTVEPFTNAFVASFKFVQSLNPAIGKRGSNNS